MVFNTPLGPVWSSSNSLESFIQVQAKDEEMESAEDTSVGCSYSYCVAL